MSRGEWSHALTLTLNCVLSTVRTWYAHSQSHGVHTMYIHPNLPNLDTASQLLYVCTQYAPVWPGSGVT
jgi:hypothetical protein